MQNDCERHLETDDLDAIAARLDDTVEPGRFYDELDFCERKLFVHFPGGESGSWAPVSKLDDAREPETWGGTQVRARREPSFWGGRRAALVEPDGVGARVCVT